MSVPVLISVVVANSTFPATVSLAASISHIQDIYQLSFIALAVTILVSSVQVSTSVHVAFVIVDCLLLNVFQSVLVMYQSTLVVAAHNLVLIVVCVSSPVFVQLVFHIVVFSASVT